MKINKERVILVEWNSIQDSFISGLGAFIWFVFFIWGAIWVGINVYILRRIELKMDKYEFEMDEKLDTLYKGNGEPEYIGEKQKEIKEEWEKMSQSASLKQTASILVSIVIIVGGIFGFMVLVDRGGSLNGEERMIINKLKDITEDPKKIVLENEAINHYVADVDGDKYIVKVSAKGEHIESISTGDTDIYVAGDEDIDEGVSEERRKALARVREITGNEDAKMWDGDKFRGSYRIISGGYLYEVSVGRDIIVVEQGRVVTEGDYEEDNEDDW